MIRSTTTLALICPLLAFGCDLEGSADLDDRVVVDKSDAKPTASNPSPAGIDSISDQCIGSTCAQRSVDEWVSLVGTKQPRNWWRFNPGDTVATDSGSGLHGTYLNGAAISNLPAPFGGAVQLGNHTSACINIGEAQALPASWTIEAIFAADDTGEPSTSVLVGHAPNSQASGTIKAETWSDTGKMGYTTPWDTTFGSAAAATPTSFKHVVFVNTPGGMKLYVNGTLAGENPATMQLALGSIGAVSCAVGWAPGGVFGGKIDELVVYTSAFTVAEIEAHFGAAKSALSGFYDCGDTKIEGVEECDDGNDISNDECNNCVLPACGDGIIQPGEECDDGNTVNLDACRSDCKLPKCIELVTSPSLFAGNTSSLHRGVEDFTASHDGAEIPSSLYQVLAGSDFSRHATVTFQSRQASNQNGGTLDYVVAYGGGGSGPHMIESAGGGYAGYDTIRSDFATPMRGVAVDVAGPGPFIVKVYGPGGDLTKSFEVGANQPFFGVTDTCTSSIGSIEVIPKGGQPTWSGTNYWNLQRVRWAATERGMYMWDERVLDATNSAELLDNLLDFSEEQGVNRLYFQAQGHISTPEGKDKLEALIHKADKRGVGVDLLFGDAGWFRPSKHPIALGHLDNAIDLVQGLGQATPVRAHFDIEPHGYQSGSDASTKWDALTDAAKRQRLADLLTLYKTMKVERDAAGVDLELTVAMPFWYHDETFTSIVVDGVAKEMSDWVIDTVDHVALMSYHHSHGGIMSRAADEVAFASALVNNLPTNQHKVLTGAETARVLPESLTFWEEGAKKMDDARSAVAAAYDVQASQGWGGEFVHSYESWRHLGEYPMRLAVPSYFNLWKADGMAEWNNAVAAASRGDILMINPEDGPGDEKNDGADFEAAIAQATKKGIMVLGYVMTGWMSGSKSEASIKEDIDRYYEWYPEISGVFFDEVSSTWEDAPHKQCDEPGVELFYEGLAAYTRGKRASAMLVANPGQKTCESFLNFFDVLVIFEKSAADYTNYSLSWVGEYPPTRFSHMIYDAQELGTIVATASQRKAGWVYVTNDTMVDYNPWDILATYFQQEAQQIANLFP